MVVLFLRDLRAWLDTQKCCIEFFGHVKGEGMDGTVGEVACEGSERIGVTVSSLSKAGMSVSLCHPSTAVTRSTC